MNAHGVHLFTSLDENTSIVKIYRTSVEGHLGWKCSGAFEVQEVVTCWRPEFLLYSLQSRGVWWCGGVCTSLLKVFPVDWLNCAIVWSVFKSMLAAVRVLSIFHHSWLKVCVWNDNFGLKWLISCFLHSKWPPVFPLVVTIYLHFPYGFLPTVYTCTVACAGGLVCLLCVFLRTSVCVFCEALTCPACRCALPLRDNPWTWLRLILYL